ncbi:MAG: DUF3742 family protein [Burkholderiaceae bacterium]
MKATTHTTFAERTGRALGRMWKGALRQERKACGWLMARGLPAGAATALLWLVKLAVLGVLLYAAFWLALLLVFGVAAAWAARNAEPEPQFPEPEWRNGPAGYGLYTYDGYRIDPHVFDDD